MARVEKYTRGAMGNMLAHYDRTKASSKSLIDPERTPLNYNLAAADQPLSQLDFIHKRLSEIKVLNRKDVNVFCDWIVTAPQGLSENEYADFFKEVYDFLNGRYGKENVISAYVHMDESQPHIHYAFIPVTIDKKKGIPKLSAKEVITLKELKVFHKDLSCRMTEFFDRDIGILNGATDLGNQTIAQLRNSGKRLKSYADTEIQTTTNIVTKVIGKDKVLVSQTDITATQNAAAETAVFMEDINAANESIKKIKEKADRNFEKSEELLTKLDEREKDLDEREKNFVSFRDRTIKNSVDNETTRQQLEYRQKVCEEREQELLQLENTPHKFYRRKLSKLNEEKAELEADIYQLKKDKRDIQANANALRKELDEKEKTYAKRLANKEREIAADYESRLLEKDGMIDTLNSTVNRLKAAVKKAYQVICNICRAAAVLWSGKGNMTEYAADLTPKQDNLMYAIIEYGLKATKEADFPDLAEKIENENYIAEDIRQEMPETL